MTEPKRHAEFLKEFSNRGQEFEEFRHRTHELLSRLLSGNNISAHAIHSRVKTHASLKRKLDDKGSKYRQLSDITDLCGIRVITHYPDEVDKVLNIVDREFSIDRINSVDKRKEREPDRFGYTSVHLIVKWSDQRLQQTENQQFHDLVAEIQIRSLLQHAWAENQHDFGYKEKDEVPEHYQRRFALLAGVLELADNEFQSLRDGLESYRKDVTSKIDAEPDQIDINLDSIAALMNGSDFIRSLDRKITDSADLVYSDNKPPIDLGPIAVLLLSTDVKSIAQLKQEMQDKQDQLAKVLNNAIQSKGKQVRPGASLLYFLAMKLAEKQREQNIVDLLRKYGAGDVAEERARRIVSAVDRLSPHAHE